jgi:two-component system OmpR family response regulator
VKPAIPILVVDDDAPFRNVLAGELRRAGFQVAIAASGEEALRCIADSEPQVVLLDLRLPEWMGLRC